MGIRNRQRGYDNDDDDDDIYGETLYQHYRERRHRTAAGAADKTGLLNGNHDGIWGGGAGGDPRPHPAILDGQISGISSGTTG